MPDVAPSAVANAVAASALYERGYSSRQVAKELGLSPATAWRLKHQALADPELIRDATKSIANKMVLASTGAMDELLDRVETGKLNTERAVDLAKIASICLQSAGAYSALSGAKDLMSNLSESYGIQPSHSSSRMTFKQELSVESTPQHIDSGPKIINP